MAGLADLGNADRKIDARRMEILIPPLMDIGGQTLVILGTNL